MEGIACGGDGLGGVTAMEGVASNEVATAIVQAAIMMRFMEAPSRTTIPAPARRPSA